mgnify:CR=1 FL=1
MLECPLISCIKLDLYFQWNYKYHRCPNVDKSMQYHFDPWKLNNSSCVLGSCKSIMIIIVLSDASLQYQEDSKYPRNMSHCCWIESTLFRFLLPLWCWSCFCKKIYGMLSSVWHEKLPLKSIVLKFCLDLLVYWRAQYG